jgi:hypothetical protein
MDGQNILRRGVNFKALLKVCAEGMLKEHLTIRKNHLSHKERK